MIIATDTTYGIDTKIKQIQTYLDNNLTWITPMIYGRIHDNLKRVGEADVHVPTAYVSGDEYPEIFIDDTQSAVIGFYVTNRDVNPYNAVIDVIFAGNLKEIYSDSVERLDERAMIEAKRVLENSGLLIVEDVKIGIKEVFAAFDQEQIKHRDMNPYFVFSYTCQVPYFEDYCK